MGKGMWKLSKRIVAGGIAPQNMKLTLRFCDSPLIFLKYSSNFGIYKVKFLFEKQSSATTGDVGYAFCIVKSW